MGGVTRRTFLARASVAAAAAGAGAAALAGAAIPEVAAAPVVPRGARKPGEPLVAHVRNIATGEVAVLSGTKEVVYRDHALVARLLGAVS